MKRQSPLGEFILEILPTLSGIRYRTRKYAIGINGRMSELFINDSPVKVMNKDWDNLVILDACRYDMFSDNNWIDGELSKVTSLGSSTGEFLQKNFRSSHHYDTVYITANPHLQIIPDTFYSVFDLVHDDRYWDQELLTVPPRRVTSVAKDVFNNHQDKRLIIHYMQPHYPFIGPKGRALDIDGGVIGHIDKSPDAETVEGEWSEFAEYDPKNFWSQLSKASSETLQQALDAYQENLRYVLEEVEDLVEFLPGKTVITSDHGNMVGERQFPIPVRGFGHPSRTHIPSLVTVPWLELEYESRRSISAEEPVHSSKPDPDVMKDRLASLGYL